MSSTARVDSATPAPRARWHPLATWQAAWRHPLAAYYRARAKPWLTPWLGRIGLAVVWALFLGGTGLAVAVYPTATDVQCAGLGCRYPLLEPGSATYAFYAAYDELSALIVLSVACLLPAFGLFLLTVYAVYKGTRGTLKLDPVGAHLATGWANGAVALLAITPLGAAGVVRIRFMDRIYHAWHNRLALGCVAGALAAVIVSRHVIYPVFWWLGPWGQWAVQLLLVLLWLAVGIIWIVVFQAMSLLAEVTYPVRQHSRPLLPGWQTIGSVMSALTVLVPLLWMIVAGEWADRNLEPFYRVDAAMTVIVPGVLLVCGPVIAAAYYQVAQVIFRLRLRVTNFS
ncbi:MAG: hypothetical protein JW910_23655 [Anaerolineae bacterium]|nr:hypothetical protein [Anaerolineae bacterium]